MHEHGCVGAVLLHVADWGIVHKYVIKYSIAVNICVLNIFAGTCYAKYE